MSDLIANYETLADQRDWSHAQMGDHIEATGDARLAASYRAAHADVAPKSVPKSRSSKTDAETVEG